MVEFRKSCRYLVIPIVILLLLQSHETSSTIIIPTLMMATAGGLLMGKMTLGGLMMMMMAANQQQNGQSFLRNLGTIPPPSGTYTSTTGGDSIPVSESGADPFQDLIVRRRFLRLKRDTSSNNSSSSGPSNISGTSEGNSTASQKDRSDKVPPKQDEIKSAIDSETQYRIMRQVAASDPLSCLPQALCGISASPPTKQSGFLNDYTYLLKQVLTRDEDVDDLDKEDDNISLEEFEKIKYNPKSKNKLVTKSEDKVVKLKTKNTKKKTSSKRPSSDDSSEEDEPMDDEELNTMLMKEQYDMEHLANEEIVDEEPDFFPYAVRDSAKLGPYSEGPPQRPDDIPHPYEQEQEGFEGIAPSELNRMSESQLDAVLASLNGPGPGGRPSGGGGRPSAAGGSLLSGMMPKISMGLSASKGDSFGDDPFFSGFKRSINWQDGTDKESNNAKVRLPTSEEEKLFQSMIKRRIQRMNYINRKRKELANITDPVEQFRIAAEFGAKVKSPRQCRVLFNNCPFNYTQVLEMIAGLRKVILGQPLKDPETPKDTVVALKPVAPPAPTGTKNIINVNTGSGSMGGITSIQHELPNGEKVEINLKMTKTGLHSSSSMKTNNNRPRTRRPTSTAATTTTMSPIVALLQNKMKKKTPAVNDEDILFDEDTESNDSTELVMDEKKKEDALSSLESLKATMLAIQKINDVTVKRKKEGKPVSYPDVLADLKTTGSKVKTTKSEGGLGGSSLSQSTQDAIAAADKLLTASDIPEPDPELISKLQAQNLKPKASKKPLNTKAQQTASSLLALSLIKVEDDEFEEDLPAIKPVKGTSIRVNGKKTKPQSSVRTKRPAAVVESVPSKSNEQLSPDNQELSSLLESIKEKKKQEEEEEKVQKASGDSQSGEGGGPVDEEPEDEEDEDDDEDSEEEEDDDIESPNFNDDQVVIPGAEYSSRVLEKIPSKPSTFKLTRSSSATSVEQRPVVEERDIITVPEKTDETSAGTIIATQTFSKRKASTKTTNRNSRNSRRKPKILYPYDSVEFPRLIPL